MQESTLFVYVTGTQTDAPCISRGFCALAHDIVKWWDAHACPFPKAEHFVRLRKLIMRALTGSEGELRPVRTSGALTERFPNLDDIRNDLASIELPSARMTKVRNLLDRRARNGELPCPVMDKPHHLYLDGPHGPRDLQLPDPRGAAMELLRRELDSALTCAERIVFWDQHQYDYIRSQLGDTPLPCTVVCLKNFMCKEGLAHGLPLDIAAHRAGCNHLTLASAMRNIATNATVIPLVASLALVCECKEQDIIDKGVRHRCTRLLKSHGGHSVHNASISARKHVTGGHVIEPSRSRVDSAMAVLDFASLYPSIMASSSGHGLGGVARDLMSRRRNAQDPITANAFKIMANAMYGQLASATSDLYNPQEANAITAAGRDHLRNLVNAVEAANGEVLYGDTDSCMVTFKHAPDVQCCTDAARALAACFNASLPDPMRVSVQTVYRRAILLSKKKYIGVRPDGSLHYSGTINVRADVPSTVKRVYEHIAQSILLGDATESSTLAELESAKNTLASASPNTMTFLRRLSCLCADANGRMAPHVEFARCESFREPGRGSIVGDSIEAVLCTGTSGPVLRRAQECTGVAYLEHWKLLVKAVLSLATCAYGHDVNFQV